MKIRFSERKDHWLDGGPDGYSYAGTQASLFMCPGPCYSSYFTATTDCKLKSIPEESGSSRRRPKTSSGRSDHRPEHAVETFDDTESTAETTSSVQGLLARSRRMVIDTAERTVVKTSMSKVVTSHPSVPLGRMLR